MKSERVTGRWRGSSTNLRLALLKMYQGQVEDKALDLSRDHMNSERKELPFRFGHTHAQTHSHTHIPNKNTQERENCLNVQSLRGKMCQRELEMKKRLWRQRLWVPERGCKWGGEDRRKERWRSQYERVNKREGKTEGEEAVERLIEGCCVMIWFTEDY